MKKGICSGVLLTVVVSMILLSGCGVKGVTDNGKISIKIGGIPTVRTDSNAKTYDVFQENVKKFNEKYPNIEVIADPWGFDLKNYLVKAAAGDLPTMYDTAPTELKTIVNSGYAKDITDFMKKYGYLDAYTDTYEKLYMYDGKCFGLLQPSSVYDMGIAYNVSLFKEAGLVAENGLPIYPQTWEDLAQTAKIIKDKTGKAGFAIASKSNQGGWHFLNIAWAFGADFMEHKDGKWEATFASPEGIAALQYVKDLRWKYNVLQDELLADISVGGRMLATNEASMIITQRALLDSYAEKFGLDVKNVAMSKIPAGPAGRFSQVSGNIYVFNGSATDEQIDAAFKWLDVIGQGIEVTDAVKTGWEKKYSLSAEKKKVVGVPSSSIWKDKNRIAAEDEIMKKYATVDPKFFEDYVKGEGVVYKFEPDRCVQQLYSILDSAVQEVLIHEDAEPATVLKKAQADFQSNFLDKETN